MLKLVRFKTITSKTITFFVLLALIPLLLTNFFWYFSIKPTFISDISSIQSESAQKVANQVEYVVSSIEKNISIQTNTTPFLNNDLNQEKVNLQALINYDKNIYQISILNQFGIEVAKFTTKGEVPPSQLTDQSSSTEFFATSEGQTYVSPIIFNSNNEPTISIAVPISLSNGSLHGAIVALVNLSDLQNTINAIHIRQEGYAFIVDPSGTVIAYPSDKGSDFIGKTLYSIPSIAPIIQNSSSNINDYNGQYKSEKGNEVLVSYAPITTLGWYVIAEDPTSEAFNQINNINSIGLLLILLGLMWIGAGSLFVSKQITDPILKLIKGVRQLAKGDFKETIKIKTNDEIQILADTFNTMENNLQNLIARTVHEKRKFESVIENVIDGVIVLDRELKVTLFSPSAERITNVTQKEAVGKNLDDVFLFKVSNRMQLDPVNFSDFINSNKAARNKILKFEGLHIVPAKEGEVDYRNTMKTVTLNGVLIDDNNEENIYVIATIHDLSAQHELEEMKLDFVSMAAHELRTPITAIRGYISLLNPVKNPNLTEDQGIYVKRTEISANQLLTLVENLLNVSKIEKGAISINLSKNNMNDIIKNVLITENDLAQQKDIQINFTPDDTLPFVDADNFRISEVITNLVTNAINYTSPNGRIDISTEYDDNQVTVHVKDTGQGIPKEAVPHLFTKFFRVGGKLEQGSKGTGLGLYISRAIVEMHKGKIWVTSELGKGSVFSFTLNIYKENGSTTK